MHLYIIDRQIAHQLYRFGINVSLVNDRTVMPSHILNNNLKITDMKKIYTLLFCAGLVTTVMAQDNRQAQHRNQNNDNRNQSSDYLGSNNHGYGQVGQENNGYEQGREGNRNSQAYNYSNQRAYGNNNARSYGDRNDDSRFRGSFHDERGYSYGGRMEQDRFRRGGAGAWSLRFRRHNWF